MTVALKGLKNKFVLQGSLVLSHIFTNKVHLSREPKSSMSLWSIRAALRCKCGAECVNMNRLPETSQHK